MRKGIKILFVKQFSFLFLLVLESVLQLLILEILVLASCVLGHLTVGLHGSILILLHYDLVRKAGKQPRLQATAHGPIVDELSHQLLPIVSPDNHIVLFLREIWRILIGLRQFIIEQSHILAISLMGFIVFEVLKGGFERGLQTFPLVLVMIKRLSLLQ